MIQVTMTGAEYTELASNTRILDQVKNSCKVVRSEDTNAINVDITGLFIPEIKEALAECACKQVLADEETLKILVQENKHMFYIRSGYFCTGYGRIDNDEYDMLAVPAFKKAWDKMKAQMEEEEDGE